MDSVTIDKITSISGIAEEPIRFGSVVTLGTKTATALAPFGVRVCGSGDLPLGIADDDPLPKDTDEYYDVRDVISILAKGSIVRGWLTAGEVVTAGEFLKPSANGELVRDTDGLKTLNSFAKALETKTVSSQSQQVIIEII